MFIFWKGKTMVDYRDDNAKYGNEETNRENGYGENKYGENRPQRLRFKLRLRMLPMQKNFYDAGCSDSGFHCRYHGRQLRTLPLCGQLLLRSDVCPAP